MSCPFKLNCADALSKALEVTKQDAERFPDTQAEIFSSGNICMLSIIYTEFDPDILFNKLKSVESNFKRFRSEMSFIIKLVYFDFDSNVKKVHLGDKMRLMTLAQKYNLSLQSEDLGFMRFAFPDIFCNLLMKSPDYMLLDIFNLKGYKNFNNRHLSPCFIGFLPSGKKYGGFLKAVLHITFLNLQINALYTADYVFDHYVAELRAIYNCKSVSEERRVELFEKLNIKETDCLSWSQNFDRIYPKYAYIHKFFGQVA